MQSSNDTYEENSIYDYSLAMLIASISIIPVSIFGYIHFRKNMPDYKSNKLIRTVHYITISILAAICIIGVTLSVLNISRQQMMLMTAVGGLILMITIGTMHYHLKSNSESPKEEQIINRK